MTNDDGRQIDGSRAMKNGPLFLFSNFMGGESAEYSYLSNQKSKQNVFKRGSQCCSKRFFLSCIVSESLKWILVD